MKKIQSSLENPCICKFSEYNEIIKSVLVTQTLYMDLKGENVWKVWN